MLILSGYEFFAIISGKRLKLKFFGPDEQARWIPIIISTAALCIALLN